mmetsp:Transcript_32431/g.89678  ORF Transcript_32431/g.89678 Transcript_32431/m.89678 type:complete len:214 (+) Transcript_32431:537-1178(+)
MRTGSRTRGHVEKSRCRTRTWHLISSLTCSRACSRIGADGTHVVCRFCAPLLKSCTSSCSRAESGSGTSPTLAALCSASSHGGSSRFATSSLPLPLAMPPPSKRDGREATSANLWLLWAHSARDSDNSFVRAATSAQAWSLSSRARANSAFWAAVSTASSTMNRVLPLYDKGNQPLEASAQSPWQSSTITSSPKFTRGACTVLMTSGRLFEYR